MIIVQEKNGRSMTRENSSTAAARLDDSMKILGRNNDDGSTWNLDTIGYDWLVRSL